MKVYLTNFHYKKQYTFFDNIVKGILFIPSIVYGCIASTRNFLYKKNIFKSYKPNVYTISVGNLTTGGTGKTPIAAQIANYFNSKGKKTAVISRGYGGKLNNKEVNVITDGETIFFDASQSGDEPYWLAKNCPQTVILTCASRIKSAKYAQEKFNCDVIILDDGYQHQKLQRDLNILVTDSEKQFSNGRVLPLGALREPMSGINRADKIIVVNKNFESENAQIYKNELEKKYNKPVYVCNMVPEKIYEIQSEDLLKSGSKIFAFSAIGQPQQFYDFLKDYKITGTRDFPDHHLYTQNDVETLKNTRSQIFVTTEKDAVKLRELDLSGIKIYALKLKPSLDMEGLMND